MKLISSSFYSKNNKKVLKQKIASATSFIIELKDVEFKQKFNFPKKILSKEKSLYVDLVKNEVLKFYYQTEIDNWSYAEFYDSEFQLLSNDKIKDAKYYSITKKDNNETLVVEKLPHNIRYKKTRTKFLKDLSDKLYKETIFPPQQDKKELVKHRTFFSKKLDYRLKPSSIILKFAHPLDHQTDFKEIKSKMQEFIKEESEILENIVGGSIADRTWRMNFKFLPTSNQEIVSEQGQWIGTPYEMSPEDAFKEGLKKITSFEELKKENYEAYFLNYDMSVTEIELWVAKLY